jgi:hypothetical protein
MHTFSCEKAVSAVFSVLLMVIITLVAGIFLYSFVSGMMEDLSDSSSPNQLFFLGFFIVDKHDSCMTIYVGNWLNQDVTVSKVYINSEPKEALLCTDSGLIIPEASTGKIQIMGSYVAGCSYDIKIVFTSGNSLISYVRY